MACVWATGTGWDFLPRSGGEKEALPLDSSRGRHPTGFEDTFLYKNIDSSSKTGGGVPWISSEHPHERVRGLSLFRVNVHRVTFLVPRSAPEGETVAHIKCIFIA